MSVAAGDKFDNSGKNGSSMGDWLRNSVARSSFGRRAVTATSAAAAIAASSWAGVGAELDHVDPSAAYHTFSKHWQQTVEIMDRTAFKQEVFQDDVTAVINHLRQMITLLQVDIRQIMTKDQPYPLDDRRSSDICSIESSNITAGDSNPALPRAASKKPYVSSSSATPLDPPPTPIFDHFLGEEILDKILEWSLGTGEFTNSLKLEQLRIHEVLLSQSRQELLVYKPVIRPLIRLLDSCLTCIPVEVERQLVLLLNQLCASLLHNQQLLHFFFLSSPDEQGDAKFLIFSLLLPFVHREGDLGQQARDALLLCMALSNTNPPVGQYIADTSNFCPLLAAGMCGLYSTLPRTLPSAVAGSDDWHGISATHVPLIPNLQAFLNALEFCNAVVQVGHSVVRNELVELVYQGFLVLVLGPALHQVNIEEVVTATAYVDLFLSYATEPQLRRAFLAFLLTSPPPRGDLGEGEEEHRRGMRDPPIITTLISRIHSDNHRVCMVTLQLFMRIIDCWCEDAMLVLVLQYLVSGSHVMVSHRHSTTQHTPLHDAHRILELMPAVLKHEEECGLCGDAAGSCEVASCHLAPYTSFLHEARHRICHVAEACRKWTWRYDGVSPPPSQAMEMLEAARAVQPLPYPKPRSESDPTNSSTSQHTHNPLLMGVTSAQRRPSLPLGMSMKAPVLAVSATTSAPSSNTASTYNPSSNTVSSNSSKSCKSVSRRALGLTLSHPSVLNLSHDDDQPESLGESSGYESFNLRTSRDSSPCSLPGSPRASHTNQRPASSSSPVTAATDLDEQFLEELMAWHVYEHSDETRYNEAHSSEAHSSEAHSSESHSCEVPQISDPGHKPDCFSRGSNNHKEEAQQKDNRQALEEAMRQIDEAYAAYSHVIPAHTASQDSDCDDVNWDEPAWSSPPSPPTSPLPPHARPTIGPFLEAVMERVEDVLSSPVPVAELLFSLLVRLASCPAPILTTLLLHPSILCQPAVRSLYQVLSALKQRIDALLSEDDAYLLSDARAWFTAKQSPPAAGLACGAPAVGQSPAMVGPQRPSQAAPVTVLASSFSLDAFRDSGKKRSLTAAVTGAVGALFKKGFSTQQPEARPPALQHLPNNQGYKFYRQPSDSSNPSLSPQPSLLADSSPSSSLTTSPAMPHLDPSSNSSSSQSMFYTSSVLDTSSSLPGLYGGASHETETSSASLGAVLYTSNEFASIARQKQAVQRQTVHSFNPEKVHAARCAILLRQLLLDLSALAQEHAVYCPQMIFDFNAKNIDLGSRKTDLGKKNLDCNSRNAASASKDLS
ncbi:FHF complex subunit HOOK interacting protein 1A isoform X2 [Hyalella azteca]|uniref:FHF complex subunit HOOK interacting protein 1A isoform X2 n=1 Tax=Hyalella azteca TaxID=294128 RepID=A0A8B7P1I3_HYAAZ|nr:FHF complex subunit HOOK interacting protein 1A isoform X2 [Hyalella azteca]